MKITMPRRGPRAAGLLLVLISTACLLAATSAAAPIEGAERRTQTQQFLGHTIFRAPASCEAFPALSDPTPDLFITIAGWYGPVGADRRFEVQLTGNVTGTVADTSGNVYRVQGHFAENGTRHEAERDLQFRGEGTLAITGPAGAYTGRASAAVVLGPPEQALIFTDMAACRTH